MHSGWKQKRRVEEGKESKKIDWSDIEGWKVSEWNLSDTRWVTVRHRVRKYPTFFSEILKMNVFTGFRTKIELKMLSLITLSLSAWQEVKKWFIHPRGDNMFLPFPHHEGTSCFGNSGSGESNNNNTNNNSPDRHLPPLSSLDRT